MKSFDELIQIVQKKPQKKKVVVVSAHDEHTLEGINRAYENGIIIPILIGIKEKIESIIKEEQFTLDAEIIDIEDDTEAARFAVQMIHDKKADFIMKGKIQTADLLKQVVNKDYGLKASKVMSHVGLFEVPTYNKLVVITDAGMLPSPDVNQKAFIIENAVKVLKRLGYNKPKVAALAAAEIVNPKVVASTDAAELKRMNQEGIIKDCIVDGPISYDLMLSKEIAKVKGFESSITGDTDIILTPDMTSGNILAKTLTCSAGAKLAGIIVGAKVPIILVSRGSSSEEKYYSIVLAAAVSE